MLIGGDPNEAHDFGTVADSCDQNCVDNLGGGAEFDLQINIPGTNPVEGTLGAAVAPTAEDCYACRAMDCSKSSARARLCSGRAGLKDCF